jgi:hypothetical protein
VNEGKIVDCELLLESFAVNLSRLGEVKWILDTSVHEDAVNIRILARGPEGLISPCVCGCGRVCLLFHESWNALEVSEVQTRGCGLVLAVLFDKFIQTVLSSPHGNNL